MIVTVMGVLPVTGYGIALMVFAIPGEPILYGAFIGGPILMVILAVGQVKANGSKAKKHAVEAKRAEYEHSHSGPQSFSFDQEKWTHETADGKREIPWSALQSASESENTVSLGGKQVWTLVPKRILDASKLENLRQLALPRGAGGEFKLRAWDYLATETSLLWRKLWFMLAGGNLFGLAMLTWVGHNLYTAHEKAVIVWGWLLASYAVVFLLTAQLWYFLLRYATARKAVRAPQTFEFSGRGVRLSTLTGEYFLAWDTLKKFRETGRAFLLYNTETTYYVLVKNCVSTARQEQMRRILRDKVKQD